MSMRIFNLTLGSPIHAAACSLPHAARPIAGKTKADKATASKAPAKTKKAASPRKKPAKEASPPMQGASEVEVSLSDAEEQQPQASSSLQAGNVPHLSCFWHNAGPAMLTATIPHMHRDVVCVEYGVDSMGVIFKVSNTYIYIIAHSVEEDIRHSVGEPSYRFV